MVFEVFAIALFSLLYISAVSSTMSGREIVPYDGGASGQIYPSYPSGGSRRRMASSDFHEDGIRRLQDDTLMPFGFHGSSLFAELHQALSMMENAWMGPTFPQNFFQEMSHYGRDPFPGAVFSSQTMVAHMNSGRDGKPQVDYRSTSSIANPITGMRETRYQHYNDDFERVAMERQIGHRGRRIAREHSKKGTRENEIDQLWNMTEEDTHGFDEEWQRRRHEIGMTLDPKDSRRHAVMVGGSTGGSRTVGRPALPNAPFSKPPLRTVAVKKAPAPYMKPRSTYSSHASSPSSRSHRATTGFYPPDCHPVATRSSRPLATTGFYPPDSHPVATRSSRPLATTTAYYPKYGALPPQSSHYPLYHVP